MNINSLFLIIIVFFLTIALVSTRFWARKIYMNYFFWSIPAVGMILYLIFFRFLNDWTTLSNYLQNPNPRIEVGGYQYSIIFSKALLLDLCPFLALALPAALIVDPKRKIASYLAPIAIFSSSVTLFGGILFDRDASFSLEYIFQGISPNPLYFLLHAYIFILGFAVLFASYETKKTTLIWVHLVAALYFGYIVLASRLLNVNWNVTGTVANDWLDNLFGEYRVIGSILNMPFPLILIIPFGISYVVIVSTCWVGTHLTKKLVKRDIVLNLKQ